MDSTEEQSLRFDIQRENIRPSIADRITTRYASFMVDHPFISLSVVLLIVILAAVFGLVKPIAQDLPDFTKPTKGFETRGTVISSRMVPYEEVSSIPELSQGTVRGNRRRRMSSVLSQCSPGGSVSMATVYEATTKGGNLYTLANLKSICTLHKRTIEQNIKYEDATKIYTSNNARVRCPAYSLPNIIASLYKRQSCEHITQQDVDNFSSILVYCAKFYRSGKLTNTFKGVPHNCSNTTIRDYLYDVYHYLTDADFAINPTYLKLALIVDNVLFPGSSETVENVYKPLYKTALKHLSKVKDGNVKLVAFDFDDLRFKLFNDLLLKEALLIFLALGVVLVLLWIFSGSFFIAMMTYVCVVFALVLGYFMYGIVFRLSFFPFLNVTTLIFLVGIGADDAFVYVAMWSEAKRIMPYQPYQNFDFFLKRWTAYCLKHAIVAMFVTSSTTAGAFYATVTSHIIAIKCFSIFTGTCILTNYILMVILFPVVVIIQEKYFMNCTNRCMPVCCPPRDDVITSSSSTELPTMDSIVSDQDSYTERGRKRHKILAFINTLRAAVFEKYLPLVVHKLRYITITCLLALGIGGLVVIFYKPKLNLPLSEDFQMFSSSSSLAQYTLYYKKKFDFNRDNSQSFMRATLLFGVKENDNRSPFDPDAKGSATLTSSFSISSKEEQLWLGTFCNDLEHAPFVSSKRIEFCERYRTGMKLLSGKCTSSNDHCCNITLPTKPSVYDYCAHLLARRSGAPGEAFYFDQKGKIRVLKIHVPLKFKYSDSYEYNKEVFDTLEAWAKPRMSKAPGGFKDGYFVLDLYFYDLQSAIASGTMRSIGIAIAIAFVVVLFTTCNFLISIYAIVTITLVIAVTTGTLVLVGWRLNIMESIVFSVAAGLSIDFTLHYGVAYQSSPDKTNRVKCVNFALNHIGAAVAMGAITTFLAGVSMSPATIMVYIQLSQFLMLVMAVSWFYATFFFLPLCAVIGPTGRVCQSSCTRKQTITTNTMEVDFDDDDFGTLLLMDS